MLMFLLTSIFMGAMAVTAEVSHVSMSTLVSDLLLGPGSLGLRVI